MTNAKTVTMSRELVEVLSREYPANVTDRVTIRSIQTQQRLAREELRAALAAPVVERQPDAWRYAISGMWQWCADREDAVREAEGDWPGCQEVLDLPLVHEAMSNFACNPTEDNGIAVVQAIVQATTRKTTE